MPNLHHFFIFLFTIFIYTLIHNSLPSLCDTEKNKYSTCVAPFHCGNGDTSFNLSYPFSGSTRPSYCGHPKFELNCSGEAPVLSIMSVKYRVLKVNSNSKYMRVARMDYWNDICPASALNSALDFTLFNYTTHTHSLLLFYNCPTGGSVTTTNRTHGINEFFCPNQTRDSLSYYELRPTTDSLSWERLWPCKMTVGIPIVESASRSIGNDSTMENLVASLRAGFGLHWLLNNDSCRTCEVSGGACGSNPSTGEFTCHCNTGSSYSSACIKALPSRLKSTLWIRLVIGILVGLPVIIIILIVVYYFIKKTLMSRQLEEVIKAYDSKIPKRYSYAEVKKMTTLFKNKIGRGGFSVVYKGKLSDGKDVAVKLLNKSNGDLKSFMNEVASISKTSHVNVVTLLGFCFEWNKRVLIYEFMPKGSLEKYIFRKGPNSNNDCELDWDVLDRIVLGIARGLEYLHRGCNTKILHFDIKPQNILLDEDFCPKISDFGLSKQCKINESHISMTNLRGTPGYIAPEVYSRNLARVTHKSDVYSFGMLILEMVGERRNPNEDLSPKSEEYFPNWIYNDLKQSKETNVYWARMTEEGEEIARKLIIVGLSCIQTIPSERPSMTEVIQMLGRRLDHLQIPPKPYLL